MPYLSSVSGEDASERNHEGGSRPHRERELAGSLARHGPESPGDDDDALVRTGRRHRRTEPLGAPGRGEQPPAVDPVHTGDDVVAAGRAHRRNLRLPEHAGRRRPLARR